MSLLNRTVLQLLLLLPRPQPRHNLTLTIRRCLIVISSERLLRSVSKAKMVAERTIKTRKTRRRRIKIRPRRKRKRESRLLNKKESLAKKHLRSVKRKRKRS